MEKPHLTTTAFTAFALHSSLQEALEDNGYTACTPIQEMSLPALLAGKDLVGQAQTGTGKTATFLLSLLNHLMTAPVDNNKKGPYAIVMAPTRELAIQIYEDALMLGRYTGLKFTCIYGGTGYDSQRQELTDGVDVIIGTVGRIIDFYKQKTFNLNSIEVVVLDEADRMFDLGFIADIRYLFKQMPAATLRKNYLFSATFSQRVLELAYEHMNEPVKVQVESEQITADRVKQYLIHISSNDKIKLLFGVLQREQPERAIIFVNTKRVAEELHSYLLGNDYKAAVLSGDIPQKRRERLLEEFKEGKLSIMVATDVAARGLHIPAVSHVINYDLPQDAEDYVHRIGRTARAGAEGTAISFACEEYVYSLPDIESYIETEIPTIMLIDELLVEPKPAVDRPRRPRSNTNQQNRRSGGAPQRRGRSTHTRRPSETTGSTSNES